MSRESRTVIISHGSHTIRAGIGIHEVLRQPGVELTARVGLRRSQIRALKSYQQQEQQQQQSQAAKPQSDVADASASTTVASSSRPLQPSDYLVGALLEEALKNEQDDDPIHVFWPMVGGEIKDWDGVAALWYHVLFFLLPVVRSTNASVTLLSLPPQAITRASSARIHKIFFEDFNCPAFTLVDSALTSTFAVGQMGACVVDVGWRGSTVSCVLDALTVPGSTRKSQVGLGECVAYLASQLSKDQKIVDALQRLPLASTSRNTAATWSASSTPNDLLLELACEIFAQGHVVADSSSAIEDTNKDNVDDEGNFDVLGALTSGNEKEAIAAQEKKNKELIASGEDPVPIKTASDVAGDADGATVAAAISADDKSKVDGDENSVLVEFRGAQISVAKSALSSALVPLTDPSVLDKLGSKGRDFLTLPSLPLDSLEDSTGSIPSQPPTDWSSATSLSEAVSQSIASVLEVERRNPLWELLIITGAPTRVVKGLAPSIVSSLQRFIASSGSDGSGLDPTIGAPSSGFEESSGGGGGLGFGNGGAAQPSNLRSLKTPDYFVEFKDRTDLAPFLGSTIYSKLVFADSQARAYTLKATYGERGPSVAFSVSASDK